MGVLEDAVISKGRTDLVLVLQVLLRGTMRHEVGSELASLQATAARISYSQPYIRHLKGSIVLGCWWLSYMEHQEMTPVELPTESVGPAATLRELDLQYTCV